MEWKEQLKKKKSYFHLVRKAKKDQAKLNPVKHYHWIEDLTAFGLNLSILGNDSLLFQQFWKRESGTHDTQRAAPQLLCLSYINAH